MNTKTPIVLKLEHILRNVRVDGEQFTATVEDNFVPKASPVPPLGATKAAVKPPFHDSEKDLKLAMQIVGEIHEKLASIEQSRVDAVRFIQEMAVEVSIAVASKILSQKIDEGSFPFQETASRLIEESGINIADQPVKVLVNKLDLKALQAHLIDGDGTSINAGNIQWQPCSHLQRGSIQLDVDTFSLFFDTALHLQEIRRVVLEAINDSQFEN